jgi:hypothetical protein
VAFKEIVLCWQCREPLYYLYHRPIPGDVLRAGWFKAYYPHLHADPEEGTPIRCPMCGRMPFVVNNTGFQLITAAGEILPELHKVDVFGNKLQET